MKTDAHPQPGAEEGTGGINRPAHHGQDNQRHTQTFHPYLLAEKFFMCRERTTEPKDFCAIPQPPPRIQLHTPQEKIVEPVSKFGRFLPGLSIVPRIEIMSSSISAEKFAAFQGVSQFPGFNGASSHSMALIAEI
jgi:hypothetical protein